MTSMMRPTANRPTQNTYGAQQPSMNQYKPGQAQPQQQSQGTPYQAYTPNANERPQYGQQPSPPRSPKSDFRQVGDFGAAVMTNWYNPQTGQTTQTGSSNIQPVDGSGWVRAPRGGQQLGGDTVYAGGTPYFNERTGQATPGWSAPQGANERISPMQPPPFQMAPAQTPWGPSMDPFAERDAFVNQINQQRMQNQIAFNSGGPTNPAAGMTPGIDYQLAMQQAGLAGGAPSMSPEYGDSLIARFNSQFGGFQQPAYYPGGTMNDGYGMGAPPSQGAPYRPTQPAYQPPAYFPGGTVEDGYGMLPGVAPAPNPKGVGSGNWPMRPDGGLAAPNEVAATPGRSRSGPVPYAGDPRSQPPAPSRPTAPNNRDVQAAFENPAAWQYQDPQQASRQVREEAAKRGEPVGRRATEAYNAANRNNWLGPEAQRAVGNMSQENRRAYLMMGGFNQNEANDYSRRVSGRRRR
jgi:hypothetical protein